MEQFIRDIKVATIYEGTTGIQSIDFVRRKILGDQAKTLTMKLDVLDKLIGEIDDQVFNEEKQILLEALELAKGLRKELLGWAKDKKLNKILEHCNNILEVYGRIIMVGPVLEHANLAKSQIGQCEESEKEFLQTKIDDFSCYVKMHLTPVFGYIREIRYNASIDNLAI